MFKAGSKQVYKPRAIGTMLKVCRGGGCQRNGERFPPGKLKHMLKGRVPRGAIQWWKMLGGLKRMITTLNRLKEYAQTSTTQQKPYS